MRIQNQAHLTVNFLNFATGCNTSTECFGRTQIIAFIHSKTLNMDINRTETGVCTTKESILQR